MYNYEKIAESCKGLKLGEIYEYGQIVDHVHRLTGIKRKSIIPSDYCYNITNRGADGSKFKKWPRLFTYEDKKYKYLGEGYCYNGIVKYVISNEEYGLWTDGVFCGKLD